MSRSVLTERLKQSLPILHKRTFDPGDPNPCSGCSDCCEYIAIPISRPRSNGDYDELLWYLLHENVWVFIDDENDWFVQVNTPCRALSERRCGVYRRRPHLCRDYAVKDCTTYCPGDPDKHLFKRPEDLVEFLRVHRPRTLARLERHYPDGLPSSPDNKQMALGSGVAARSAQSA